MKLGEIVCKCLQCENVTIFLCVNKPSTRTRTHLRYNNTNVMSYSYWLLLLTKHCLLVWVVCDAYAYTGCTTAAVVVPL